MEEEGGEEDTGGEERESVDKKIFPYLKQNPRDHKTDGADCDV